MSDRAGIELALLGPALEAAVAVAAAGGDPGAPPVPAALRPYTRFRTLPPKAREQIRAALDADEAFRAHVAAQVDPDRCGPAAMLWLSRPAGWAANLAGLVDEAVARVDAEEVGTAERDARRRLPQLEQVAARAEARAAAAEVERDDARAAAADALGRSRELAAEVDALRVEVDRLGEERQRAVRELKETEARLHARIGEVRRLREAGEETPPGVRGPEAVRQLDAGAVAALVARALEGIDAVDGVLGELAEVVGGDEGPHGGRAEGDAVRPRRRPLRMGRGLDERSAEGARWLLGRPGVVVVVDGYNLSMTVWPDLELAAQREQTVRAMAGLAGGTGATFEVVFDGDDVSGPSLSEPGVAVRFTPPGVEADDEVIARVGTVAAERPVVVVSDDRRVRDGARHGGANVVGSEQLRSVLLG